MINHISAKLSPVSIHYIGKHSESEGIRIKPLPLSLEDDYKVELIFKYLLSRFKEPAFSAFTFSSGELEDNPLYNYASEIFADRNLLHERSEQIAKYLYNNSQHPNIKAGEFIMCYLEDILVEDEMLDAIGIFKSESKDVFLKLLEGDSQYSLNHESGLALGGLDKGCLILNTEKSSGYKLCIIDKSNKQEAAFWSQDFLNVKERSDDYHFTSHYIQLTKDYVDNKKRTTDGFSKENELAVMNASEKFFKSNETFNESEYMEELASVGVEDDFAEFKRESQRDKGFFLQPDFDISPAAVKKNNGIFKSVIKLDKNFSLYIHGDRSMIERGEDEYGRKFYKLYYEEER